MTISQITTRKVYFPIIESISIDGYVLYPGNDKNQGLKHTFMPGVNVIVGINGIGKTTLLNLLYRMLSGDKDLRDGDELGGAQRKLASGDQSVFSRRVPDKALSAKASLKFRLHKSTITVQRSLKDLSLESLIIIDDSGNSEIGQTDDQYKLAVMRLAGVDDFFDWVLLLKYLVFYLEDRRSLVWDKWAQTEIFRILFLSENTQANYKNLLNTALSADSQARNIQNVLTNEEKKLTKLRIELDSASPDDLKILTSSHDGLVKRSERLNESLLKLDSSRLEARDNAARLKNDAEKLFQEERVLREKLLSSIFPKLTDYGAFVLASMESMKGCIVCGCKDETQLTIAREKIHENHNCPVCDAIPTLQEQQDITSNFNSDKFTIDEISKRLSVLKSQISDAEQAEETSLQDYIVKKTESYEVEKELRVVSQKLAIAENISGLKNNNVIQSSLDRLQLLKESVDDYKDQKTQSLEELKSLVQEISKNVTKFKDQLISDFGKIISHFLAENCELTFRTSPRNIGQSTSAVTLLFPEFHVLMTSGVFLESGTPREETISVSESQKEFIELAFRMAILSACTIDNGCSLIIETPEANLDAVFIPKAGNALNEFSFQNKLKPSTIIATTNINGSKMIPSLLGILDQIPGSQTVKEIVATRTLNLLDVAAKSAALREFSDQYNDELLSSFMVPH